MLNVIFEYWGSYHTPRSFLLFFYSPIAPDLVDIRVHRPVYIVSLSHCLLVCAANRGCWIQCRKSERFDQPVHPLGFVDDLCAILRSACLSRSVDWGKVLVVSWGRLVGSG